MLQMCAILCKKVRAKVNTPGFGKGFKKYFRNSLS